MATKGKRALAGALACAPALAGCSQQQQEGEQQAAQEALPLTLDWLHYAGQKNEGGKVA